MEVKLTVTQGTNEGQSFSFQQHEVFLIGRDSKANFKLPSDDPYVSRLQCMLEINPPLCRLIDLTSTNGTFVNGKRVTEISLKDKDSIQLGRTSFKVEIDLGPEAAVPSDDDSERDVDDSVDPGAKTRPPFKSPIAIAKETINFHSDQQDSGEMECIACSQPLAVRPTLSTVDLADELLCNDCRSQSESLDQVIDGYLLLRRLGKGGMGEVWLALNRMLGKLTAIKSVKPAVDASPAEIQRFVREARILFDMRHPNIIQFYEAGQSQGVIYLSMEYVDGWDVARLIARKNKPLATSFSVSVMSRVLSAVEYAHRKGLVHRDIKPANILIRRHRKKDKPSVKLADFGLARLFDESRISGLSMQDCIGGSIGFMPPEQVTGFSQSQPSVDVFACGATLYYMLTGQFIYELPKQIDKALIAIIDANTIPIWERRSTVAQDLGAVIHRAIEPNPKDRWSSAQAMLNALKVVAPKS